VEHEFFLVRGPSGNPFKNVESLKMFKITENQISDCDEYVPIHTGHSCIWGRGHAKFWLD